MSDQIAVHTRAFPRSASSPAAARRFVIETLREHSGARLIQDASLVVSELAANAVIHACSPFVVHITARPKAVRIGVSDNEPLRADRASALPVAPTHGLGFVAAMATRWGAQPVGNGKEVWAELHR